MGWANQYLGLTSTKMGSLVSALLTQVCQVGGTLRWKNVWQHQRWIFFWASELINQHLGVEPFAQLIGLSRILLLFGRPTSEQGAGFGGSERIITRGDPHQKRVLGGILQTEVSELSSSLGHLHRQNKEQPHSHIYSVCNIQQAAGHTTYTQTNWHCHHFCIEFASNGRATFPIWLYMYNLTMCIYSIMFRKRVLSALATLNCNCVQFVSFLSIIRHIKWLRLHKTGFSWEWEKRLTCNWQTLYRLWSTRNQCISHVWGLTDRWDEATLRQSSVCHILKSLSPPFNSS